FILEGFPAVILGVVTLIVMTDRPRHAKWLTAEERGYLEEELAAESHAKDAQRKFSVSEALRMRNVWLLALGIFATNTGGYALGFWLPTTVKSLSGGSDVSALFYSGLFYLFGVAGVLYSGRASDRTGHHKWYCVAGQVAAAVLLALSAIPGQPFGLVMMWLCLTGLAAYSWPPPFWTLPTLTLTSSAAAASIGLINIFANLAGYLGNHLIGWMRHHSATDGACLLFLAGCYLMGGVIVSFVSVKTRPLAVPAGAG
ncbi:MAG: MFS transporter, partial [Bryobacteraceae bacterium]